MDNNMKFYLDEILDDNENNNNIMKTEVDRVVELLEEMKITFTHQMEAVLKPVYKQEHDPLDVLLLQDLLPSEKLIMVVLRNRPEATLEQLSKSIGLEDGAINRALRKLMACGYVIRIKVGTYKLNLKSIF